MPESITITRVPAYALHALRHRMLRQGLPPEAAHFEGDDEPDSAHFAAIDGNHTVVGCCSIVGRPFPVDPPTDELPQPAASSSNRALNTDGSSAVGAESATPFATPVAIQLRGDYPSPRPTYQLRGMAVDTPAQRLGVGRLLLGAVDRHLAVLCKPPVAAQSVPPSATATPTAPPAAAMPPSLLWCNARLPAVPFYQRLGWIIASTLFHIPTAGPHHRMFRQPE